MKAIEGYPELEVDEQARELAAALIADGPIPEENPADALHIAVAAVNGIDYLVTWNFAHINNARLKGNNV